MNESIQISARTLGQLAQHDFCARCLWIRSHCGDRTPFAVFPGIFSSIDKYSKGVTAAHFEKRGAIPTWFNELGDLGAPMSVPHWSRFRVYDDKAGITLSGMPDEMIRKKDGSVFIVDYKTARFTDRADALLPLYVVQLNVYAHIATKLAMGSVSGLALLYYEPVTEILVTEVDELVHDKSFLLRFVPKLLPIELKPEMIPPLLKKFRMIYDAPTAPTGTESCKDCQLLDKMIAIATGRASQRSARRDCRRTTARN